MSVDPGAIAAVCSEIDEMLRVTSMVMHWSLYLMEQSVPPHSEPGMNLHMGRLIQSGEGLDAQPVFTISHDQLRVEMGDQGRIPRLMGHMWAVFVYAAWEHDYRPRLAKAKACLRNEVQVALFGDLRHLRHDILHGKGVASEGETGKCEVLKWFRTGDPIEIRTDHVLDFQEKWADERGAVG